jgi:hypothetical protein
MIFHPKREVNDKSKFKMKSYVNDLSIKKILITK